MMFRRQLLVLFLFGAAVSFAQTEPPKNTWTDARKAEMASRVREEFLRSWGAYKQYAWGHDELRPLSKTPHDWYGTPLVMTAVDALDTMSLMGLDKEAAQTRDYIATHLSFDQDIYIKNFEITIRLLGGLLSNYQVS